jgi:hypothetical protein
MAGAEGKRPRRVARSTPAAWPGIGLREQSAESLLTKTETCPENVDSIQSFNISAMQASSLICLTNTRIQPPFALIQ